MALIPNLTTPQQVLWLKLLRQPSAHLSASLSGEALARLLVQMSA